MTEEKRLFWSFQCHVDATSISSVIHNFRWDLKKGQKIKKPSAGKSCKRSEGRENKLQYF